MKFYLSAIFLIFPLTLFAIETIIQNFTATSNGKDIIIEFRTISENNVLKFEIERSINNSPFKKITTFEAKGFPNVYKFIDEGAFLKENENNTQASNYSYRIKIVFSDKTFTYSNSISVSHAVNSFHRTWGMIKEMFR